jgi:hypothetical protein
MCENNGGKESLWRLATENLPETIAGFTIRFSTALWLSLMGDGMKSSNKIMA